MASIGDIINGYQILETITENNFCNSYKVNKNGAMYFMKEYVDPKVGSTEYPAFLDNQKILAKKLNSMGSITEEIIDHFDNGNNYFQVKEYLSGTNLREWLANNTELVDRRLLCIIFSGIIKNLHNINIIHQDLKPEQVMMVDDAQGKKTKLGVRPILTDFDWSIPDGKVVRIAGTQYYASPEHFIEKAPKTFKTDVFTLGIMLCEFLTNGTPFTDATEITYDEYGQRILSGKVIREPKEIWSKISDQTNNFLLRCIDKEPKNRPTVEEVQDYFINNNPYEDTYEEVKLANGTQEFNLVKNKIDFGRQQMKLFFGTMKDEDGNPLYKYFDSSNKPMLQFIIENDGYKVSAPFSNQTTNYFLLNNDKIESNKIKLKKGDKLNLYSTNKDKIVGSIDII